MGTWDKERLRERRDELRTAGLPRARARDVMLLKLDLEAAGEEGSPSWVRAANDLLDVERRIDAYLAAFVRPAREGEPVMIGPVPLERGRCPGCGSALGGFLGSFRWGLAHGSGSCSECGWPCRAYHFVYLDDPPTDEARLRFEFVLAVHPDEVVDAREAAERRERERAESP